MDAHLGTQGQGILNEQADSGVCVSLPHLCSAVSPCLPAPQFPHLPSVEPTGKSSNASPAENSKDLVCMRNILV